MTVAMEASLLAVLLMANLGRVDALNDMKICYILDAILIAYSVVLTVLYIRLKLYPINPPPPVRPEKTEARIYAGLTPHASATYETIRVEKKAQM